MTSVVAQAYLETFDPLLDLLEASQVAAAWEAPSVLVSMTVGDLAAHLARAVTLTPVFLANDPAGTPVTAHQRLTAVPWATSGPGSAANTEICQWAHDDAAAGPQAVAAHARSVAPGVRALIEAQDPDRRVGFPAEGVSLSLDDYLALRLLEVAAHSDDLACSVGLPTPGLPARAQQALSHLLVDVAVVRHGWPSVLRTLTRSERAPVAGISVLAASHTAKNDEVNGSSAASSHGAGMSPEPGTRIPPVIAQVVSRSPRAETTVHRASS
ncbi:MAG: maleylpyruvate isomerase N-terminal domain-containing protein [Micrococcales bacterium]|nr:maleylpyruvate isomerase N-terminal domain-containing protein [Micrococcales bacterium]